jgi:hypothetical protein
MNTLDSSLLLGLDSALCCFGIGCTSLAWSTRMRLALAFGACDATGSVAGALLHHPLAAPPSYAVYLCCAVLLAVAARYSRNILYALPVLFSLESTRADDDSLIRTVETCMQRARYRQWAYRSR